MKRRKIGNSRSKQMFTRNALRTHPRNELRSFLMRGGIRL